MYIRSIFLLSVFMVMVLCPFRAYAKSAGVPMLQCAGLPCVEVAIAGGRHLKLLIDSGDANSVLDRGVADQLGLRLEPIKQYPRYALAKLPGLQVGDVALGDQQVVVMDLKKNIQQGTMPEADGSLAYTALKGRVLIMDYRKHRLSISPMLTRDRPCSGVCGEIAYPTFGKHGPPIVTSTDFTVNGRPVTLQIDTLYSGSMLIYPTSVAKLGLQAQAASTRVKFFPYTDGGVPMVEATAATEGFGKKTMLRHGPLYFATSKVHTPDGMFDGTAGDAVFRGHVLIFDFQDNRFHLR